MIAYKWMESFDYNPRVDYGCPCICEVNHEHIKYEECNNDTTDYIRLSLQRGDEGKNSTSIE
jgi:hypothetical protein